MSPAYFQKLPRSKNVSHHMNPLVKKEIRLLLPGWAASLLFALGTWLMPQTPETESALRHGSPWVAFSGDTGADDAGFIWR